MIATLERLFESDEIPLAEDVDLNELRIASTLNGRVVVRGDFDALTGEMLLSALSNLTMPTPAPDGTPDSRSAAKRTADGFTETDPPVFGLREDRYRWWSASACERSHQCS